jgi:TetR/AcrR family acrAB operon transcriptional repressor
MKKTKTEALKTKAALIDAGLRVFARDGYAESRLATISSETGMTRGAFYWHFKDKADLLNQIDRRESARLDELVNAALVSGASPFARLRSLLWMVIDNFYESETFRMYIDVTWHKLSTGHFNKIMPSKITFVQGFLNLLEKLLRDALQAGEVKKGLEIPLVAFHLSCLINGFYRLYFAAPDQARDINKTKRLFADYLASIKSTGNAINKGIK